jgi:serine/threonine-protein kinase
VDGSTLDELIEARAPLSVPIALAIALQLVETLGHVHAHGVVHCDVQPKNIWISRKGEVKLANFFLAHEQSVPSPAELLDADSGFETPSYLSPEQLLSERVDARSDLFSAGVVLFEMLTKHRPFDASDTRSTTQRIRHEPPPALHRLAPEVPPAVERIVLRALQKLPADRFHDAREMVQLLQQALQQFPERSTEQWLSTLFTTEDTTSDLAPIQAPAHRARVWARSPELLKRALIVYLGSFLALVAGALLIQRNAQVDARSNSPRPYLLELVPEGGGSLLCVARPWARVFVDGQLVDTTPFARPIPLAAGTHYLRFEHPNAPPERRTITVSAGQQVLVEVDMQLPVKAVAAEPDLLRPPRQDAGARSP